MSIGPTTKDQNVKVSVANRAQYVTKRSLTAFFSDPSLYLFYGSLTAILVGLVLNHAFPWQLYVLTAGLGVFRLLRHFYKPEAITIEEKKPSKK